jgi:hypothetical protein
VDSAISCSTHRPKLEIGSDTTKVALSRPCAASSPIAMPIHSPELEELSSKCVQFCSATWQRWSSAWTFTPTSAAGTSPKYDSTE